jgi:hypothetical protein
MFQGETVSPKTERSEATPNRRRRVQTIAKTGAVGVVAAGLIVTGLQAAAQASPEKVLQAVDVKLGQDGTVNAISSTAVRQGSDGKTKDDEKTHDPSKVADELPIRVLTAYRFGKKSGTDLNDLKDKKGRVYIDVTVQNTTVRPQLLTYDSEAESKTAPALVGTPLTVIASADLGKTPLSQVVSGQSGSDSRVTNGVASLDSDGRSRVQWATMLAPPRLGTSATFTLVQDVEDFTPPTFDISVQPGLATDASISRMVDSVFKDDNGTQQLTSRTIELLSSVGTVLTDASSVLSKVESQLDGSASELGSKTIGDLKSSSSSVTSSLQGLAGDLDSLQGTFEGSLDSSRSAAVKQLSTSLAKVKDKVLGDPDAVKPTTPPATTGGCAVPVLAPATGATVLDQLQAVTDQLTQLSTATAGCKDQIVINLKSTIGVLDATCAEAPTTALGSLACASDAMGLATQDLVAAQDDVTQTFDGTLLAKTTASLNQVLAGLDAARTRAKALPGAPVSGGLGDVETNLNAVKTSLTQVDARLTTINQRATAQLALLQGDTGALEQADDLADLVCALPAGPERDEAIALLQGSACGTAAAEGTESLRGKLTSAEQDWQEVKDQSSTTVADSLGTTVDAVLVTVDGLLAQVRSILDGSVGDLQSQIAELNKGLDVLYTPIPVDPVEGVPQPPLPSPRAQLTTAFNTFAANQSHVGGTLDSAFARAKQTLTDSVSNIGGTRTSLDAARARSEAETNGLFSAFTSSLAGVGSALLEDGKTAVRKQRAQLDQEEDDFSDTLGTTVAKAMRRIGSQVGSANRDLDSSEKSLVADLQAILVNIGQPNKNGSGLLGSIYTGARRTGASNVKIADADKMTEAFGSVRGAALDDLYLQQAQVSASLEAESVFPAFDLDLPAGSASRTVFSFHVGQD